MPELPDFTEIRATFKAKFIGDCYEKKHLNKKETSILREEMTKIEAIENQAKHMRSLVEPILSLNDALPKSNLTL